MKHIFSTFTTLILLYGTVYGQKILSNKIVIQSDSVFFLYEDQLDSLNSKMSITNIGEPIKVGTNRRLFSFLPTTNKFNNAEKSWVLGEDFYLGISYLSFVNQIFEQFSLVTFEQLIKTNNLLRGLPDNYQKILGNYGKFFLYLRTQPIKLNLNYFSHGFNNNGTSSVYFGISFTENNNKLVLLLDQIPRQEHLEVWEIPFDKEINRKRYFEWEKKREIPLEEPLGFFLSFEHQGQTYLIKKNTSAIYKVGKKLEKVRDLPHAFDDGLFVFDKDQDSVHYILKKDFHRPELTFKEIIDNYGIILMQ